MKQIDTTQIKQIELKILEAYDDFCKKNNLTYFLCNGTLLGAIRHKGFIPWDDDIDVFMPRPDFERFVKLTKDKGITEQYDSCFYRDTKCNVSYPFVKVVDNKTKVFEKTKNEEEQMGIWIDVFPIDGFSDNEKTNKAFCRKKHIWKRLCFTYSDDLSKVTDIKKKIGKAIVLPFLRIMGQKRLFSKFEKICTTYDFEKASKVGCTVWGYNYKEIINKDILFPPSEVEFEGKKFMAPNNPDAYLTALYGNYMQLPPENQRINHEMQAFLLEDN